jgi:hypothetical protein
VSVGCQAMAGTSSSATCRFAISPFRCWGFSVRDRLVTGREVDDRRNPSQWPVRGNRRRQDRWRMLCAIAFRGRHGPYSCRCRRFRTCSRHGLREKTHSKPTGRVTDSLGRCIHVQVRRAGCRFAAGTAVPFATPGRGCIERSHNRLTESSTARAGRLRTDFGLDYQPLSRKL